MATIIREGKEIRLTDEEVRSIVHDEHVADIRYEIECALSFEEEDGTVSFDSFASCPCGDYASPSDAREDFIEECVQTILQQEDYYDHTPYTYSYDYTEIVLSTAEDMDFLVEGDE